MSRDEIIALIIAKASEHGLVPWELLGGAIAESGLDPDAWRQGIWPDWSAGLFQQTIAYASEGDQSPSDENVALIRRLYADPAHACDVAAVQYRHWRYEPDVPAEQAWCAYNWPGSYRHFTDNPNLENYRRGLAEAREIVAERDDAREPEPMLPIYLHTTTDVNLREAPTVEAAIVREVEAQTTVLALTEHAWRYVRYGDTDGWMASDYLELGDLGFGQPETVQLKSKPQLAFNAATPTYLQKMSDTCSIATTIWMLRSIGVDVDPAAAYDVMVPRWVDSGRRESVGLRDASGAGIVQALKEHWGVAAYNIGAASFDQVLEIAGQQPLGLGGHGWGGTGHWTAVRGREGDELVLANPAGTGPIWGQQRISRELWGRLATSWSAVVITGRT